MSVPKSEEEGVLREWAPLSRFLGQIPLTIRKGLFFEDIKLTCVDAVEECIVVGTNTGTVFWYDRTTHYVQQFSPEKTNHVSITAIRIVSTVDYMVAAGDSSGVVSIFKIPIPFPDWLQHEVPSTTQTRKAAERFTVGGLHHSSITALEFSKNGQKLFSGDSSGLVVFTEIDFFLNLTKARILLNESHSIVQLAYNQHHSILVTATTHRCVLSLKVQNNWEVIQIGQKERTSLLELGGTIFVEEGQSDPLIYSARPGLRLWLANTSGTVQKTIIFKEGIKECTESATLLSERTHPESRAAHMELGRILSWVQGLLVAYNSQFLMLLNAQSGKAKAVVPFAKIASLCVTPSEIFLVHADRDLMRLAFSPDLHDSSIGGVGNIARGEKVSPLPNFNLLPITGTIVDVYNSTVGAKPQPSDLPCEVMYGQDTARLPPVLPLQGGVAELRMEPTHHLLFPAVGKQQFDEIIYRKKPNKNKKWRRSYEVQKSKNDLDHKPWSSMNGPESLNSYRHSIDAPLIENAYEIPSEILTDLTNLEIAIEEVNQAIMENSTDSPSNQENQHPEITHPDMCDSSIEVRVKPLENSDSAEIDDQAEWGKPSFRNGATVVDEEILNNNFLPDKGSYEDPYIPGSVGSVGSHHLASSSLDERENLFSQSCLEMKDEEDTQQDELTSCTYSHINFSELEQCSSVMEAAELPESFLENSAPPDEFLPEQIHIDEDPTKIPSDISGSPYDTNLESSADEDHVVDPHYRRAQSKDSECEELKDYCFIKRELSEENRKVILPWLKDLTDLGGGWKEVTCPSKGIWLSSDGESVFICQSNLSAHRLGTGNGWEDLNLHGEIVSVSPNSQLICIVNSGNARFATDLKSKNWKQLGLEVGHVSINESDIWYVSKGDLYHFTLQSDIANLVITPQPFEKIYARDHVLLGLTGDGQVWAKEGAGIGEWKQIDFCELPIIDIAIGPDHLIWLLDVEGSLFVTDRISSHLTWQVVIGNGIAINVTNICVTDSMLFAYDAERSALYINQTIVKGFSWMKCRVDLHCLQLSAGCLLESDGSLWLLAKGNKLYSVSPYSGIYEGVSGVGYGVTCISGIPQALWILTDDGNVHIRKGITGHNPMGTSWFTLNLEQIKEKKMQLVDICLSMDVVWACDIRGHVLAVIGGSPQAFERTDGFAPAWVVVDGSPVGNNTFTKVCVGIASYMVWALDSAGNIYVREGIFSDYLLGTGWVHVKSLKASHITICGEAVWALTKEGVYKRVGISTVNYIGDEWIFIPGSLDTISVSPFGKVWGVDSQTGQLKYLCDKTFPIAKGTYFTDNDWTFV